jgi:hypothetical protein
MLSSFLTAPKRLRKQAKGSVQYNYVDKTKYAFQARNWIAINYQRLGPKLVQEP